MTTLEAKELFHALCLKYKVDPRKVIRRGRNSIVCEARMLIIKDLYAAGVKTGQIRQIIPRDPSTLWYARRKVM